MLALAGVVLAVLLLTGCGGSDGPEGEPSIRGVVTAMTQSQMGVGGSMRVVWTDDTSVGAQASYDAADVGWTDKTRFYRRAEGASAELLEISIAEVKTGDVVEAWFEGAVAESYPVQAGASSIVVIGSYAGELPVPPGLEPEPAP